MSLRAVILLLLLASVCFGEEGLYLFHLNIHGKHQTSEPFQFDTDTGGQNVYVHDLVKALAKHPRVARVEVATRLLRGNDWNGRPLSPIHAQARETVPG